MPHATCSLWPMPTHRHARRRDAADVEPGPVDLELDEQLGDLEAELRPVEERRGGVALARIAHMFEPPGRPSARIAVSRGGRPRSPSARERQLDAACTARERGTAARLLARVRPGFDGNAPVAARHGGHLASACAAAGAGRSASAPSALQRAQVVHLLAVVARDRAREVDADRGRVAPSTSRAGPPARRRRRTRRAACSGRCASPRSRR